MDGRGRLSLFLYLALLISIASSIFLTTGCSTVPMRAEGNGGAVGQVIREASAPSVESQAPEKRIDVAHSGGPIEVWGQRLKNSKFDFPVVVNPAVEYWITYFTGKGRRHFDKYLERSRYFIPVISKVLKSHNMPQDLVYLAMIESGFNNSAKSHAKAVGPWQFIRQTGQRYGLTVDYWLDERRDTRKSTAAALAYLKELYQEFGSWELAAAGYNAGENKVRRAIAKYRTRDFWEISRYRFFRRETRDYVPKIIAAAMITKNPEQFGFVNPFSGGKGETNPTINASLAEAKEGEVADDEVTPKELGEPDAKNDDVADDSVPDEKVEEVANEEEDLQDNPAMVSQSPNPGMTPSVYMVANPGEHIIEFEIRGPADLFAISKASGLPFSIIKMLNPELLRWCTPPQMKTYRIKLPQSVKDRFLATYNDDSFDRRVVFMRYTVRRGDTVSRVAKRFGIETSPIRELNRMGISVASLRVGSSINLPIPTGYKRVIASMYDDKPAPSRRRKVRRMRKAHRRTQSSSAAHDSRLAPRLSGT